MGRSDGEFKTIAAASAGKRLSGRAEFPYGAAMHETLKPVDTDDVRRRIVADGYAIVDGVVAAADVAAMRDFWLDAFSRPVAPTPLVWGPYLGEANGLCFDRSPTHRLYRSYDFLWNEPYHALTRHVALALSGVRNAVIEADSRQGEYFSADRYGIYVTTSYYPADGGWLEGHRDQVDGRRHWHFILPLTFLGSDFAGGGLYLEDRHGTRVDVDALCRPGSVVFFDGSRRHGVDPVRPLPGKTTGRLQMFAIPVLFEDPALNARAMQRIPVSSYVLAKLRQVKQRLFYR